MHIEVSACDIRFGVRGLFFPAKAFPVNAVPRSGSIAASPRGETACVRRTGIRAKRNTPKKARKFKHIEPPIRTAEKSAGKRPRRIALHLAGNHVARPSVEFGGRSATLPRVRRRAALR